MRKISINPVNKWALIIIFLMSILVTFARISHFPQVPIESQMLIGLSQIVFMYLSWIAISYTNALLNYFLPYSKGVFKRIVIQVLLGVVIVTFCMGLFTYLVDQHLGFLPKKLAIIPVVVIDFLVVVIINLVFFGYYFFDQYNQSAVNAERLKKEQAELRLHTLKNQLNPHFLFNSLSSLNSLIFDNQALASQFLQHLAKVYRYVLANKETELVPLHKEINFIQDFIFLLETRFGSHLRIEVDIEPNSLELGIVPVTTQILIENAIKHNAMSDEKPLAIKLYIERDMLVVENTLQRKKLVETSNKIGLENMRNLYSFITSRPIDIQETDVCFRVKVPLSSI